MNSKEKKLLILFLLFAILIAGMVLVKLFIFKNENHEWQTSSILSENSDLVGDASVSDTEGSTESIAESISEMTSESLVETSIESSAEWSSTAESSENTTVVSSNVPSSSQTKASSEPEPSTESSSESSSEGLAGFYNNIEIADVSKSFQLICSKKYKLPDDFSAPDLVPIPEAYHYKDGKIYNLNKTALDAFIKMSDAAAQAGHTLVVISGHRTKSYQEGLYNYYVKKNGKEAADTYSARPRHSEHETGFCADFNMVDRKFKDTELYTWLVEHAANYGYILRYPEGKEGITGYIYEPWHWRYVGEIAPAVVQSGLTYDEYYEKYLK